MKGIIFNAFEGFVAQNWGDEFYESILDATELETQEPFVGPGTYPDGDLLALVATAVQKLDVPLHDALVAFGSFAFKGLVASHPAFVDKHVKLSEFLKTVDSIIHIEVRKLYPESVTPTVLVEDVDDATLRLSYHSDRKLCAVLEGLVQGAAEHFDTQVTFAHDACMHAGASTCEYTIGLQPCAS